LINCFASILFRISLITKTQLQTTQTGRRSTTTCVFARLTMST